MNLRVVILMMFLVLSTLSLVVASDVMSDDAASTDHNGGGVSHVHHRTQYMDNFLNNHPNFNVWDAVVEVTSQCV